MVTRSVAVDVVGLFLLIRFLSNRSFLLFSSYDDDHETTLMVIMMVMTIMMTMTLPPLLWHQVSFSVELPPLSFVRRTSWAVAVKKQHDDKNEEPPERLSWLLHQWSWWHQRWQRSGKSCWLKTWCWAFYQQCGPLSFPESGALLLLLFKVKGWWCWQYDDGDKGIDKYGDWRWWLHRTAGPRQGSSWPRPGPPRSEQEKD